MWIYTDLPTNWLTDCWNYWSDKLPTYSAQCTAEGSSNIGIPPVTCHVFVNKINAAYFFSRKKTFFLCIFSLCVFKNINSYINFSKGHMDQVKYKFHKKINLHHALWIWNICTKQHLPLCIITLKTWWFSSNYPWQNVVMLMSDIVDWLIPDIPKDISLQIHKEKILLVDLFMKEEQGKNHIFEGRLSARGKENCSRSNNNNNSTMAHQRSGLHSNSATSLQHDIE